MNLFDALGPEIAAEFGPKRATVPEHYFFSPEAAEQLAGALAVQFPRKTALVFSDKRTRVAAGAPLLSALGKAGFRIEECLIPDGADGSSPVCDDVTKDKLKAGLPKAEVYVAVGSGVVNDLTKWLAGEANLPYAVYATAASMNGYTAANVAPSIKGVKSLFRASAPRIIAADPRVIEGAPFLLTTSGLGDSIAKPVSTADWILNNELFGENFSPAVAQVINRIEPKYLGNPQGIARREGGAIGGLFDALIYSGCAMTLQGSSLPASGGEHLISHTLDMLAHVDHIAHDMHGRQVGVGTIFAAELYRRVMALEKPRFEPKGVGFDRKLWGPIADAVETEYRKKQEKMVQACELLNQPGRWEKAKKSFAPVLLAPEKIKTCLQTAGAAHRFADLGVSRDRFLTAVHNCAAIRGRFTSIDLAYAAGILPGAAEKIVDRWLV